MLGASLAHADVRGLWAAINTMIPPFAMLILLDFAVLLFGIALTLATQASAWPLFLVTAALIAAIIALGCAWLAGGSRFVSLRGLARIPFYVMWKIPMYFSFARHGAPKEWQRTGRR